MRISLNSARPAVSAARRRGHGGALAIAIFAAALSSAADARDRRPIPQPSPADAASAPPVDRCGHPIVTDNIGKPYIDPVCIALSDHLQPPLYIPAPECNRGVAPYDSSCFFERLFTVMTASPGPRPLAGPPAPYPVK
ncbi:MAG: hypothetical protein AB7F41_06985 [Methylocystis sp.]|uniref:hypothetical protein n=1 Tax=Methylocystis sp. TaxID=1911079 RepID=UPI003D110F7A